jgi:hypothetical protein
VKKHLSRSLVITVALFSFAAKSSFAGDGSSPQPAQASQTAQTVKTKTKKSKTKKKARTPQSVNGATDETSAAPTWTASRNFDPNSECPKLFFDEIFKDRISSTLSFITKSPKKTCEMDVSSTLPDAESLEAVLAANPVTALGLPAGSITGPSCLYKNYKGTNLDTVFGRFYPKETATEVERMTGLAEYYYHMNKIKYAEQGILSQMAGIDSILGGAILPDKNCADPYNPFSAKWCDAYHSYSCRGSGRVAEVAAALKVKVDKIANIQKQVAQIPEPDQPESKAQIKELKKQIPEIVGADVILNSPKFKETLQQSGGDVATALRAQLQDFRADFARKLAQFQDASECINSSKSVSCPDLENVVNKVPDDFLPEMVEKGTDDPAKTSLAQAYMDHVSCLQVARGKKDASLRLQLNGALAVGTYTLGAGELGTIGKALSWAWALDTATPEIKDAFHACVEASHAIAGDSISKINPYSLPSCSQTGDPAELMALHNYTACGLGIGGAALVALTPLEASGAVGFVRNPRVFKIGKTIGVQGASLVKQVLIFSVGSNLLSSFINVDMNILGQESGKVGTETLGPSAKMLSNWLSSGDTQEKAAGKHAMNQLASGLDPSKFAGLTPDEANKLFQDTAANAYKILLNYQQVLRGDQMSGLSLKWNQRTVAPAFYAQVDAAYARYYGARSDMDKIDEVVPKLSDEEKKTRITQDQASMDEAELHIARNISAKILYDFMTPEYRTGGNPLDDKQMQSSLSLIYDANATGMLTDIMRKNIQELLAMDGWSPVQVQKVIQAQLNGQNEDNTP